MGSFLLMLVNLLFTFYRKSLNLYQKADTFLEFSFLVPKTYDELEKDVLRTEFDPKLSKFLGEKIF